MIVRYMVISNNSILYQYIKFTSGKIMSNMHVISSVSQAVINDTHTLSGNKWECLHVRVPYLQ